MAHFDTRLRAGSLLVAASAATALALSGCGSGTATSSSSGGGSGGGKVYHVAFLAASSQNAYNQAVYQGVQQEAKKLGNVQVSIYDGKFDGQTQFNQMQTVAASGKFQGIVIVPQDTVSIGAAVGSAQAQHIPVVTALFPIGPNLTQLKPQVPGVVATVASPPAVGATKQAQQVVAYCQNKNPCRTVILIGLLSAPFDKVRYDAYRAVLDKHPNIKVVSTLQGGYDRNQSLSAMQDALQANHQIDVLLSNADQMTEGAQIALQSAGLNVKNMFLTGAGGTTEAVQAVRQGLWKTDYLNFPVTQGEQSMQQVYNAMTGKPVQSVVDSDKTAPFNPFADKSVLDAHPSFKGEWSG
jgi:ribose transport system substrate-binding protein